ncbi:MAG: FlgO family outer membrane protein [bacterium]
MSDLKINNQSIRIQEGVEVPFTTTLIKDRDTLELIAWDRLGNQTSANILLTSTLHSRLPVLIAMADTPKDKYLLADLFAPKDNRPPYIKLKDITGTQTVFLEKVYIEGDISDENMIEDITINSIPILRQKGRYIFFNHIIELKEGENIITILAKDESGNIASKEVSIIRRIPKALQTAERMSLTALPFEQKGIISEAGYAFQDNLINALVNQNRFRVIEREQLNTILQEQRLSETKLFDKNKAITLGRLVSAQSIITGSIIETRTGIEVIARIIDTETSEILAIKDVFDTKKDLPSLSFLAEGLAIKFHREFPLVNGLIIKCKEKEIFTNLGQEVTRPLRRLIIYRDEPINHPSTKIELGSDNTIIGKARVTQVMPEMSKANLLNCNDKDVKTFDKVITE